MPLLGPARGHLLRRAGFGASLDEAPRWNQLDLTAAIDVLVDYDAIPDDVDGLIGVPGYLGTVADDGPFAPNTNFVDGLQRWVFRMVHTKRPLQEKMALFWHNHFATGVLKISDQLGGEGAVRALVAKPDEDRDGLTGQLELLRSRALGNFRDLLLAVSQDTAMVAWLDGDSNFKEEPQENYARELMELFTIGVDQFTEEDVYAGARVFTGWNLEPRVRSEEDYHSVFRYDPRRHDDQAKTFSFPIYPDGGRTIPARGAGNGFQDGVDLITALAGHPATGPRLARKLYAFFVNEKAVPDEALIAQLAATYYASGFDMRQVVRELLYSPHFHDESNHWARYSWPAEFVPRLIREVGWTGFSADLAVFLMIAMGQTLFNPPNVAGWPQGPAWFSTTTMLSRMNFAALLTWNQSFALQEAAQPSAQTPDSLLDYYLGRLSPMPFADAELDTLRAYLTSTGPWTGSAQQVRLKGAGLAHLITASGEYQFV